MTDVGYFLKTSVVGYVVQLGRQIILAHLFQIEVPESLPVKIGVVLDVLATVLVASGVSEPIVVSCARSDKRRSLFGIVANKCVGAVEQTVLHKNRRFRHS